jgi:hypothetical protein
VNKTTVQALQSNGIQFNKWHNALIHLLIFIRRFKQAIWSIKILHVFRYPSLRDVLKVLNGLSDDDSLGIEACSRIECHFFNHV